ncbi:hypothetical protein [Arsenicicoccus dermatophilus]|uniref:hypothetical protein n=1 Tax=Arsenicicoccus dermatophilus TaxID=1076331 RepID=UPI0039171CF1
MGSERNDRFVLRVVAAVVGIFVVFTLMARVLRGWSWGDAVADGLLMTATTCAVGAVYVWWLRRRRDRRG